MNKIEKLRYEYYLETGLVAISHVNGIEMKYLNWLERKVSSTLKSDMCRDNE